MPDEAETIVSPHSPGSTSDVEVPFPMSTDPVTTVAHLDNRPDESVKFPTPGPTTVEIPHLKVGGIVDGSKVTPLADPDTTTIDPGTVETKAPAKKAAPRKPPAKHGN